MSALSGCSQEIEYEAKFCSSYGAILYIQPDLITYVSDGILKDSDLNSGFIDQGQILRENRKNTFEYSGELNFVVPKNLKAVSRRTTLKDRDREPFFMLHGSSREGTSHLYYIDREYDLVRFDEMLVAVDGHESAFKWTLCGGKFKVQ